MGVKIQDDTDTDTDTSTLNVEYWYPALVLITWLECDNRLTVIPDRVVFVWVWPVEILMHFQKIKDKIILCNCEQSFLASQHLYQICEVPEDI